MMHTTDKLETLGRRMYDLAEELFPVCRSMTGPGVRETLRILEREIPLTMTEVPSGEQAFDWEIPPEWRIRDAYIKDRTGNRLVDFRKSNLHVVGGSVPVRATMTWDELKGRVHSLPEHPEWIPYRTSFFQETWGFCAEHCRVRQIEDRVRAEPQSFDVCIDAELVPGSLTYGECLLEGETDDEVLVSTHVCHPSLANDNLSGIAVSTFLAKQLKSLSRRHTYRFLFLPATIGPIAWLSRNQQHIPRIKHGLVLAVLGDAGPLTYRRTRSGNALIDRAAQHVLTHEASGHRILDFEPFGYDQRQFCSPGINLPMGCLMRTPNGQYPEYHTSADDLELLRPESLADSLDKCLSIMHVLEHDRRYQNTCPHGEPQLGRRGLYRSFSHDADATQLQRAVLWVLNLSDGEHSLLDIAHRAGIALPLIQRAADALVDCQLLVDCETSADTAVPLVAGPAPVPAEACLGAESN